MKIKSVVFILLILMAVLASFVSCGKKVVPQKADITIITPKIDTAAPIGDTSHKPIINKAIDELPAKTPEEKKAKEKLKTTVNKALKNTHKIDKEQTFINDGVKTTITPEKDGEPAKIGINRAEQKKTYTLETEPLPSPEKKSFFQEFKELIWWLIIFILLVGFLIWLIIRRK